MTETTEREAFEVWTDNAPFKQELTDEIADAMWAAWKARAARASTNPSTTQPKVYDGITPRPLEYSLEDYHKAPSSGPLHFRWVDKPHRLLYDLIAALNFQYQSTIVQPAADGYVIAVSLCDAESKRWLEESQRHLHPACADRDLERAKLFSDLAKKIKLTQPNAPASVAGAVQISNYAPIYEYATATGINFHQLCGVVLASLTPSKQEHV